MKEEGGYFHQLAFVWLSVWLAGWLAGLGLGLSFGVLGIINSVLRR